MLHPHGPDLDGGRGTSDPALPRPDGAARASGAPPGGRAWVCALVFSPMDGCVRRHAGCLAHTECVISVTDLLCPWSYLLSSCHAISPPCEPWSRDWSCRCRSLRGGLQARGCSRGSGCQSGVPSAPQGVVPTLWLAISALSVALGDELDLSARRCSHLQGRNNCGSLSTQMFRSNEAKMCILPAESES